MFGLGAPEGSILMVVFVAFVLPFLINGFLARSRGKSVPLMLFLTVIFSWIVTLILACLPKAEPSK